MSDNNNAQTSTENNQEYSDPVVEFLSRLEFNTTIFDELFKADKDPELYTKFMQLPDIYVLKNLWHIIGCWDPNNKQGCPGYKDHIAWINLIKWFLVKIITDPQWTSYIGHFGRLYGGVQHPSSYYPIVYNPRFTPNHFFVKGQPVNMAEENANNKDPEEVYDSSKNTPTSPEDAFAWKE